jgi:transcriptional pleiotropic regulator of transition state genes
MRSTGVVRKLDNLRRIVIPKEVLDSKGMTSGTPLEVFVQGDEIILRKYNPGCKLCGSLQSVIDVDGVRICVACCKRLADAVKRV